MVILHASHKCISLLVAIYKAAMPKQVQMDHRMTTKVQQITVSKCFSVATEESRLEVDSGVTVGELVAELKRELVAELEVGELINARQMNRSMRTGCRIGGPRTGCN